MLAERRMDTSIDLALRNSGDALTAESFADAGLRLDAFEYSETSDFMMDDLWFFNVPPFDFNSQPYSGF
jgi:hypothetical protein